MTVRSLDHYNIRASRQLLEQLRDFYRNVIGLADGPRPPFKEAGYWLYAGDRAVLHLSEAGEDEVHNTHVPGTFNHAAFACSGRPEFEKRLVAAGVTARQGHVPGTNIIQLFVEDPAGNGVELSFGDEHA
jgi:catechol-2,3-dioxygenase